MDEGGSIAVYHGVSTAGKAQRNGPHGSESTAGLDVMTAEREQCCGGGGESTASRGAHQNA